MSSSAQDSLETLATELMDAVRQLTRRLRAESGPNPYSWTVLAVMARLAADGPFTAAELARTEAMKPQSMGAILALLEELGYAQRRPHATDGRQIIYSLTAQGIQARDELQAAKRKWLAKGLADLGPEQRATLAAAADLIRQLGRA